MKNKYAFCTAFCALALVANAAGYKYPQRMAYRSFLPELEET